MRDRTADLLDANQALSQLSYSPVNLLLRPIVGGRNFTHLAPLSNYFLRLIYTVQIGGSGWI